MRAVNAILALSAIAFGQPAGRGLISGTIIDASDNLPVRKAIVTLTLQGKTTTYRATARTDDSGQFRFDSLPAGKYGLRAEKAGNGRAVYGAGSPGEAGGPISLGDGETRDGLKLRFFHPGAIEGRVFDDNGGPVPGVSVVLLHTVHTLGERALTIDQNTTTDDRGEYRMRNIDAGQYYLRVAPTELLDADPTQSFAVRFYGDTAAWKDSTPVYMHAGDSLAGLDFHLNTARRYRIQGRVTGVPDPGPPSKDRTERWIEVSITQSLEGGLRLTGTANARPPDYRFDFGDVPDGSYYVDASLHDGNRTWAAAQLVDSRRPAGEILLSLAAASAVKGHLRVEGEAEQPQTVPQITLIHSSSARNENISVRPGPDGSFTLSQVPPGEWFVNLTPTATGAYLKSVRLGDKDVLFTQFPIEPGSEAALDIVVSTRFAKLQGQVDGAPGDSKRAGIVLAPTGRFHTLARYYYGTVTDDEGQFRMQNLAPGKYKIFALEKLAAAGFRNPEAADRLDALGEEIELREGGTLEVHPRLIPMETARRALPDEAHR